MITDKFKFATGRSFWLTGLIVGVVFMAAAAMAVYYSATQDAEDRLRSITSYMKVQCDTYTTYNQASESQGVLRAIENTRQSSRNIMRDTEVGEALTPELLHRYTDRLWLSGIIVLDEKGKEICSYYEDVGVYRYVQGRLNSPSVLLSHSFTERSYAVRDHMKDGSYVDMAASPRLDAPGIVVAYFYTPLEYVRNYALTLQSLLSGYSTKEDGTIVIATEGSVIASNDKSLLGVKVAKSDIIQTLRHEANSQGLVRLTGMDKYGMMVKQRDYYIYAYVPVSRVLEGATAKLFALLMVYIMGLLLLWVVIARNEGKHQRLELENELQYQKNLEAEVRRADMANQTKTRFLQRMSHDIRTPINGICGMLEVAEHYRDDLAKQAECREKIKDASHLLLELINEVLDMGKLESGEVVLEHRPFNVREVNRELMTVIEKLAAERDIELIDKGLRVKHRHLIGSPSHVKRLLMNILSNAVKYNKEHGSIELSCRELPSEEPGKAVIEFTCADTGIGMSQEYQQRIFEPFTQENSGVQSQYGGSGLGMAIMKALVDKMGGTVEFTSQLGVGTTFVVRLPFEIDTEYDASHSHSQDEEDASIDGVRILIAEDNDLNMEIADFVLTSQGAVLTKAHNGREALDIFYQNPPGTFDIILMDVMMPEMDGYEAARSIRALRRPDAATIPIVAMTANAFTEDRLRALDAGMNEHITKPLDVELVITTISRLLRGR